MIPHMGTPGEIQQRVEMVCRHMFLNLVVLVAPFQSRNEYVLKLVAGNGSKAVALQSYMSAAAGLMEFMLNPIMGRISDRFGRKIFLLLSPLVNFVLKTLVFVTDGKSLSLVAADRILGGAITTICGSTTCAAAISDLLKGPDLAGAFGNLGSYAGLGVVIGPFVSGQILALTGRVKFTYLFGAVVAAFQLAYNSIKFEETLAHIKPFDLHACNPLVFLKIFTGDATVARLALVAGLQCFPEGKSLADMNIAHTSTVLKMSQKLQTYFVMGFGMAMILAGKLPKLLIPAYLSQRNFSSVSNYITVVALTLWGKTRSPAIFLSGLALLGPSMERRTPTSAMATDLAVASGLGNGEFAGCFANWRALCVAAAPLLYGTVVQKIPSVPGAAYFSAALITLLTEFMFRSIPVAKLEGSIPPKKLEVRTEATSQPAATQQAS